MKTINSVINNFKDNNKQKRELCNKWVSEEQLFSHMKESFSSYLDKMLEANGVPAAKGPKTLLIYGNGNIQYGSMGLSSDNNLIEDYANMKSELGELAVNFPDIRNKYFTVEDFNNYNTLVRLYNTTFNKHKKTVLPNKTGRNMLAYNVTAASGENVKMKEGGYGFVYYIGPHLNTLLDNAYISWENIKTLISISGYSTPSYSEEEAISYFPLQCRAVIEALATPIYNKFKGEISNIYNIMKINANKYPISLLPFVIAAPVEELEAKLGNKFSLAELGSIKAFKNNIDTLYSSWLVEANDYLTNRSKKFIPSQITFPGDTPAISVSEFPCILKFLRYMFEGYLNESGYGVELQNFVAASAYYQVETNIKLLLTFGFKDAWKVEGGIYGYGKDPAEAVEKSVAATEEIKNNVDIDTYRTKVQQVKTSNDIYRKENFSILNSKNARNKEDVKANHNSFVIDDPIPETEPSQNPAIQ